MRELKRTTAFKRDYQRIKAGRHRDCDELLSEILMLLAEDSPLPEKHQDHALVGNWSDYRECHIKPDLLLIYRKAEDNGLKLIRLGSHSELYK